MSDPWPRELPVRGRIDSAGASADHGDSGIGQLLGQAMSRFDAVTRRQTRAHNRDRAFILGQDAPFDVEEERGIVNLA